MLTRAERFARNHGHVGLLQAPFVHQQHVISGVVLTLVFGTTLASLVLLVFATGFKNGYEPNLNTWRGNYAASLELKIPVFNGYKTKYQKAEANANLNSAHARTADIERQIASEVHQALAGVNSSLEKIASTETQIRQAEKAVSMARVRYNAGVITNLDLLDAETALSQTKLIRVRALFDYTVSLNALDRATGKRQW